MQEAVLPIDFVGRIPMTRVLVGRSLPARCRTFFEYDEIDSGPVLSSIEAEGRVNSRGSFLAGADAWFGGDPARIDEARDEK